MGSGAKITDEVLDSFALLAYLGDEPGAAVVERALASAARGTSRAWMTIVNVGEVLYVTERHRGPSAVRAVIALMDSLAIQVVDAGRELTFDAAHIKANHALPYADAFAVALAHRLGATLMTGDPEFRCVESLVRLKWLEG